MSRSLAGALTTAQQSASHEPHVAVTIVNALQGGQRLDFTVIDQTSNTIGKHDVCVPADGSVIRIRSDNAGGILYQRNTSPGSGAGYAAAWTTLVTGRGNLVACCAKGTRVMLVYNSAAGTVIHWRESTDSGASFGAEQSFAALGSTPNDLAAVYKTSGGDCLIAWVRGTNTLGVNRRVAGAFGGAAESATGTASMTGIAACYTGDYAFIITGTEGTTLHASIWTHAYGDGFEVTAATFGTLRVQHQAESDSLIVYSDPSAIYEDTLRYAFLETDTFAGGTTRVYRSWTHPSISAIGAAFTHRTPVPTNVTSSKGVAIATESGGGGYVYETAPNHVQRAAYAIVSTTLTDDVVAVRIDEKLRSTSGYIDIDNSSGAYAGPPTPIQLGNTITVGWGYNTSSGALTSLMADLWLAGYEYRRTGGRSVLRLHVQGGWEILARARQRGHVVNTGLTYQTILARVFARAGMQLTTTSPSSRSTTVTPAVIIPPDTPARTSVERLLDQLTDRIRMDDFASAVLTDPLAAAAADYTFGTTHAINVAEWHTEPPPISEAHVIGNAAWGEAFDTDDAEQGLGTRDITRDANSASGATANATATAHLRQRELDAYAGRLVVPPHCGCELLDLVDFTDLYMNASAIKRRVNGIRWDYDRHAGRYEQTLTLGAR